MSLFSEFINTTQPFEVAERCDELRPGTIVYRVFGKYDDYGSVAFATSPGPFDTLDPRLSNEWAYMGAEDVRLIEVEPRQRQAGDTDTVTVGDTTYDVGAPIEFRKLCPGEVFRSRNSGSLYVKLHSPEGINAIRLQPGDGRWFRTFNRSTLVDPLSPVSDSEPLTADDLEKIVREDVESGMQALSATLAALGHEGVTPSLIGHTAKFVESALRHGDFGPAVKVIK